MDVGDHVGHLPLRPRPPHSFPNRSTRHGYSIHNESTIPRLLQQTTPCLRLQDDLNHDSNAWLCTVPVCVRGRMALLKPADVLKQSVSEHQ